MAVYQLNCLNDIHETLRQYQYVMDKLEQLQVCQRTTNYLGLHVSYHID